MALKITCVEAGEVLDSGEAKGFKFEVTDLSTNEQVKNTVWFEKAKSKSHIKLGKNNANLTYIALAKFAAAAGDTGEATFEDKTSAPRQLGTSDPNAKLRDYMDTDLARYDELVAKGKAAAEANKGVKLDPNSEEGIIAKMNSLLAKMSPEKRAEFEASLAPKVEKTAKKTSKK